jgi:hypothetical protein
VLLARIASYTVLTLFVISAMRQFGFDFTVLLGAAGIVTVAVGFASQTSASNLISGLFLTLERAVQPGDVVTVGGRTGEVISVDLLSTKLRTFDNLLVRIPNETMVKSEIVSLNRFPIRRFDLTVGVAYDSDLGLVQKTLLDVAHAQPAVPRRARAAADLAGLRRLVDRLHARGLGQERAVADAAQHDHPRGEGGVRRGRHRDPLPAAHAAARGHARSRCGSWRRTPGERRRPDGGAPAGRVGRSGAGAARRARPSWARRRGAGRRGGPREPGADRRQGRPAARRAPSTPASSATTRSRRT